MTDYRETGAVEMDLMEQLYSRKMDVQVSAAVLGSVFGSLILIMFSILRGLS